ncbi:MAG: cyclic nucleotide-binding protein [Proteobacteria bacterium]|nr:cyclic nucleotide-binding protein [Pseudomonadota bacterium]
MHDVTTKLQSEGIFAFLTPDELEAISANMLIEHYADGALIRAHHGFFILLEGEVSVLRESIEIGRLLPGNGFGEWGVWGWLQSRVTLRAEKAVVAGRLDDDSLVKITSKHPHFMLKVMKNVSRVMDLQLEEFSQALLSICTAPSQSIRSNIVIRLGDEERTVRIGTPLSAILPKTIHGEHVVSALFNQKHTSLNRPLYTSGTAEPLTRNCLEGRTIYRQSLVLLALEAANRFDPRVRLRIGASIGSALLFEIDSTAGYSLEALAENMNTEMRKLVAEDVVFRRDYCSLEEAKARFMAQGWDDAVLLLRKSRSASVALVSCGELCAIEITPLVSSAGVLDTFCVAAQGDELMLFHEVNEVKPESARTHHPGKLAKQHDQWLHAVGLKSVGAFNNICISGDVSKLIRVSEGFHEKRINQIADMITQREKRVKVICIAGPSSSGKTTFLKRLSIQLQVNGLNPKCISLDDYYVDRELTVRDEHGEYDFEAFEAINSKLLGRQLRSLVDGETIRIAHYDFASGINHPNGGPEMSLGPNDVLLLEGIHGLNPDIPVDQSEGVFRIFINPMTVLPLDHASCVSASDVRLLRRIVRDRHTRAITAADNIMRWPSVRRGEIKNIFPYQDLADAVFNTSLVYELSVLKVYAERYLLEVDEDHPAQVVAIRLRRLIDRIVSIYPDHVPQASLLREFIGGSCFK